MKFLVAPLSSVVAFRLAHLLITIAQHSLWHQNFVLYLEFGQLLHFLLHDACKHLDGNLSGHVFVAFEGEVRRVFCIIIELFFSTAFVLPHAYNASQKLIL